MTQEFADPAKDLGLFTSPGFGKLRNCNFPKPGDHEFQSEPGCFVPAVLV
jgi:hypothetical protein